MKKILHRSSTRGLADHGWLLSRHTFSFADYYDPDRMHFGLLRVLNDDIVEPAKGFSTHPHNNMEIISIPLQGALKHKDSTGLEQVIREHDVQIMSAGTGIYHSEYNHSQTEPVNFLQIWVIPKVRDIQPRYDQKAFPFETLGNKFELIVSPEGIGNSLKIFQNAWFSMAVSNDENELSYSFHDPENGLYIFMIEGKADVANETIEKRDGLGIWETSSLDFKFRQKSQILLMEVPMK